LGKIDLTDITEEKKANFFLQGYQKTVNGFQGLRQAGEVHFSVRSDPDPSGSLSLRTVFGGMSIRTRCVRRHIARVQLSPEGVSFIPRSFSISHAEAEDEMSPFAPPEGGVII
jgi:hypothetical protein